MRRVLLFVALLAAGSLAGLLLVGRQVPWPADLRGTLVYVSDREGSDALYLRPLPAGPERRLTYTLEPAREPALAPDGRRVAFTTGGRIALVPLAGGPVQVLTLGVERRDGSPSWSPDGRTLVITSRAPSESNADIHTLSLPDSPDAPVVRRPLTVTPGLDEREPVFAPDGGAVVFVREDGLVRLKLADGRSRRLTAGLRRSWQPRFLPDGRLLYLWSQDKLFGLDCLSPDGRQSQALSSGSARYRTLALSPDGRYLMATLAYDLRFRPLEALKPRATEELHLLDAHGRPLGPFLRSWRRSYHSPAWGG